MNCHFVQNTKNNRIISCIIHKFPSIHYSLTHLGIAFFSIIFIVSFFVIASISTYYNNLMHTQLYHNMRDILHLYNNELSSDLSTLETYLFQLASYNTDISVMNTTSDNLNYQNAKMKIYLLLSEALPTFSKIDGLYCYSLSADDYVSANTSPSYSECSNYIKDFLHSNRSQLQPTNDIYVNWIPFQTQNQTYLIRFLLWNNTVVGAWSSVDTLTSDFNGIFSNDSVICYADQQMHILNNPDFSSFEVSENRPLEQYQFFTHPDTGMRYLTAFQELAYSDCFLIAFIPLDHINNFMIPVYQKLFIIIAILFLAIFLIAFALKQLVDIPMRTLENILTKVTCEDASSLLPSTDSRCREISTLNQTLHDMVQKIQNLKINVYEEKLLQTKLEMQYMKAQVSPHFLINCLTTFSTLATSSDPTGEHRYILPKMVDILSNHLRYTLSARSLVSLKKEYSYVDNYLQLIAIRYPGCLAWKSDLPADIQDASVFPMLLLMLTENTIKYNMIMGEKLQLIIRASFESQNGKAFVHLIHIDSGSGFTPEILTQNNSVLEHPEICKDGHNIGIYNIAKSLQLTYHGEADIRFSNEPGMGARIDIIIPYTPVSLD